MAEIEARLLAAALEQFIRHGYGGASMRSIAAAAKLSRTTLAARFSTKQDLFRAIMRQHIASMSAAAYLRTSARTDLAAGLKAYADRALAYSLEGDFLEINRLIYSASDQFPEIGMASSESTMAGIEQVAEFIGQCAAEDGIACRDPRVPAEMFILLLRGWYGCVMLSKQTISAQDRMTWAGTMVDRLIAGRQGW